MSINITDALIAVINSVSTSNTEVNTSDSRLLPTGVWANALTLDGVQIAETDSEGKWRCENWGEWKRALPMLDELASQNDVTFELKDVFEVMEDLIKRLVGESFGKCESDAPEASVTGDAQANLLGEACEAIAGNPWGENMFTIRGRMKGDTHDRNYGFSFKSYGQVSLIFLWREIRDIRPNVPSRWEAVELNGSKQIAYRNSKSDGWRFQKKTVLFWSDRIASLGWTPEEMEEKVGDHPFYKLLMD